MPRSSTGTGTQQTMIKLSYVALRPDRDLLTGTVELDEPYVGGRSTGHQGGSTEKAPVVIAVEGSTTADSGGPE